MSLYLMFGRKQTYKFDLKIIVSLNLLIHPFLINDKKLLLYTLIILLYVNVIIVMRSKATLIILIKKKLLLRSNP